MANDNCSFPFEILYMTVVDSRQIESHSAVFPLNLKTLCGKTRKVHTSSVNDVRKFYGKKGQRSLLDRCRSGFGLSTARYSRIASGAFSTVFHEFS